MDIKTWNKELKYLREIIFNKEKIEESKNICLDLHSMVHSSYTSGIEIKTYEDILWEDLDEITFKTSLNDKGRTIAYGIWHSTRIEDITMNLLVTGEKQIFSEDNWKERINSSIIDTGNALNKDDVIEFSKSINMHELKNYRNSVGKRTREIIKNLDFNDMKRKFEKEKLQCVFNQGAVLDVESANWLIDFWGKKNVAGILLMPVTRHNLVHINECLKAKNNK